MFKVPTIQRKETSEEHVAILLYSMANIACISLHIEKLFKDPMEYEAFKEWAQKAGELQIRFVHLIEGVDVEKSSDLAVDLCDVVAVHCKEWLNAHSV